MPTEFHCCGAFRHLPGLGPKKIDTLARRGIRTWSALAQDVGAGHLPGMASRNVHLLAGIEAGQAALTSRDLRYLTGTLHRADHWRILADFLADATFLDIETSGDELPPEITVVIVRHRGQMHYFTTGQNLDRFLDLLDHVTLLVTFNGASFDVPQLENHFHISLRDIAHVDLRWVCYHAELRGGLKEIERMTGLIRPPDLIGVDGAEADWLWRRWQETGNAKLLQRLTRYCAADVIGLEFLARRLIARHTGASVPAYDWHELPALETISTPIPSASPPSDSPLEARLRERLRSTLSGRSFGATTSDSGEQARPNVIPSV